MAQKPTEVPVKFGTFKGVFTPSLLTILGVIMYLRFGWVVGEAGILGAIVVVLLAHVISITTGLSISSIATNRSVKAGGDYYMISRSLGLPIGGAIGLTLFLALAISTSLYLVGFSEAFLAAFHLENTLFMKRLVGSVACVLLTALTFFSTSLALKVQYGVLAAIALSLISLFAGATPSVTPSAVPLWFGEGTASFEMVFAVFFPAVTGFTAGVAMSGDLKDPRRAIPLGTMTAIGVGLLVYLAIPVYLGLVVDPQQLRDDPMIWLKIAWSPTLVIAGIFAATLSSALGSVMGAPRYLQALAQDRVVPAFLGRGHGPLNEPRLGTIVTFMIAETGILVGELDLLARLITMFFLASYGFACLASGLQTWSSIPSFRPSFRVPAWVSFLGAAVCLGIMFKLDATAMAGASLVMIGLFLYLRRREEEAEGFDIWHGFWTAVVQKGLLVLNQRKGNGKSWKPNVVVFGGNPSERPHLTRIANSLFADRGLLTYFCLIKGDILTEHEKLAQTEVFVAKGVQALAPRMMSRVIVTHHLYEGILHATHAYGFAGLLPNTMLMGWAEDAESPTDFVALLRRLSALDRNQLFLRHDSLRSFGNKRRIDIWWGGRERNGQLMMLLAYFLTCADDWEGATIRLNVIVPSESQLGNVRTRLRQWLDETRLPGELNLILHREAPALTMRRVSAQADLVLLGLREPREGEDDFLSPINAMLEGLGSVLLVRASSRFDAARLLLDEE